MTTTFDNIMLTLIEIDETEFISNAPGVKAFHTAYAFDRNVYHHYCSPQKLYMVRSIYFNITFQDWVTEDEQERIYDAFRENGELGTLDYFDAANIERMIANGSVRLIGTVDFDADSTEDDIQEYFSCNY